MKGNRLKRLGTACLAGGLLVVMSACSQPVEPDVNLVQQKEDNVRTVSLFSPMEKTDPDADNVARNAADKTIRMAEEQLGITVDYHTYTAEDHQDKTYDDVAFDRARNDVDDLYLLNPDTIRLLAEEGKLMDLSGLECAKNLRDVVKAANTIDGKLVAVPQEVVAYGLFINQDMFDRYNLKQPETPEEFLECCRVFKENGIETPVGANRWWLETFVLAQAYADLYNGGNAQTEIAALNSGKSKYSDYMRPGFKFLKKMIDRGYIDAEKASVSEAIEGEGQDFRDQKTPIVMAYWGAANSDTAYGDLDFNMQVIGFPSSLGAMPVVSMTGYSVCEQAQHREDAMDVLDVMLSDEALQIFAEKKQVISASKNVETYCVDALKPLNDRINEGVYVLASNAGMKVEQWGNMCLVVRKMLQGAGVEECLEEFDQLQGESLKEK